MATKHTIDIITLGCSKNLVDSERLMRELSRIGWHCTHDAEVPRADVAVINTCGFIGDAKQESIQTILQMAARKSAGKLRRLYVMGCLSERYLKELESEIPEVDRWFGKFDFMGLVEELSGVIAQHDVERVLTTPIHYAYLKISEGCNRFCSYCAIPLITGRHTSRPIEELVSETEWLVKQGVKEINIIAQDLSSYGLDLYGEHKLPELIETLASISGVEWLRLHYAYPADFPMELLDVMARHKNICKYLDLALQHSTNHMLGLMRRHITAEQQDQLIATIRERVPGIVIRTTLLVGHPRETEEDFKELLSWTRRMHFERLGAFAYSDEEGTYAHRHYKDDIPEDIKQQRRAQIMAVQQEIAEQWSANMIGKKLTIIVDREEDGYWIGRTEYDSPEVDCEVLVKQTPSSAVQIGAFIQVKITHSEAFDLYAEIC